jgi:sugar phosphate isomerase/epimerase
MGRSNKSNPLNFDNMKKTTFLLLFFATFGLEVASVWAQQSKPLYSFPVGLQAYTYRNSFPKSIENTLDTIQMLGITELEGGNPKGMTAEVFKGLCEARGIKIVGTSGDYEDLLKDPQKAADQAKLLGAKYLMCPWIPHKVRGGFTFEEAKKAAADFNQIGKVLAENGITFCYHNHGFEFQPYQNGTLFDYMVQNTNPKYVSFEMDIMWAFHGGADPAQLLKKHGKRWKLLHLKDLKKGVKGDLTGGTPQGNDVTLGTGQLDIPAILKAAKKLGIKHYFIEDESSQVAYQLPRSIAYLKSLKQ